MWVPKPNDILIVHDGGAANMGDVADEGVQRARWQFSPEGEPSILGRVVIAFLRVRFSGGSGANPLTIRLDSHRGEDFDHVLWTFATAGVTTGEDINHRIPADELYQWIVDPGDFIVLEWTNPDSPNMTWAAELGVANAAE